MKKIWKRTLSVFCASLTAVTAIGLTACTDEDDVINAYDIAVKNGFQGTETEWLASLNGADGKDGTDGDTLDINDIYETWKNADENNKDKTFSEFLKEYLGVEVQLDNDVQTIAKNVSSTVNICAGFTTTTGKGSYTDPKKTKVSGSSGSGVVYRLNRNESAGTSSAYIITNYHVIYSYGTDADDGISDCIYVYPYGELNGFSIEYRPDGRTSSTLGDYYLDDEEAMGDAYGGGYQATYVGGAMDYDIAVLQINFSDSEDVGVLTEATIGDSNAVTVGEKVFAIGNANGKGISVTSGALSVESEYIEVTAPDMRDVDHDGEVDGIRYRVMRTDAAINHGNSGGGLYNAEGELIGITNAKSVEDETDNMGYALPITQVSYVVENILDNVKSDVAKNYVSRATLGVTTQIMDSSASIVNGLLKITETLEIVEVGVDSVARGQLKAYDILQTFCLNGGETVTLTRNFQLVDLMLTVRKGDTVTIGVKRNGQPINVTIKFDKDSYFKTYK